MESCQLCGKKIHGNRARALREKKAELLFCKVCEKEVNGEEEITAKPCQNEGCQNTIQPGRGRFILDEWKAGQDKPVWCTECEAAFGTSSRRPQLALDVHSLVVTTRDGVCEMKTNCMIRD